MATSSLSLVLALFGGLLTMFSPCILPVLPIIVGRSLQSHRYGPLALVSGLVGGFAVAGSLLGISASWFTHLAGLLRMGAIALLLIIGLLTLFPQPFSKWRYRFFGYLPTLHQRQEWTAIAILLGWDVQIQLWLAPVFPALPL
ncbi:MAG: hypothetical protein WA885_09125 [Phormidesmis sp.]